MAFNRLPQERYTVCKGGRLMEGNNSASIHPLELILAIHFLFHFLSPFSCHFYPCLFGLSHFLNLYCKLKHVNGSGNVSNNTSHLEQYPLSVFSVYIVLPKAPEILEGQGVGPETDIWAIGVLSFIM